MAKLFLTILCDITY